MSRYLYFRLFAAHQRKIDPQKWHSILAQCLYNLSLVRNVLRYAVILCQRSLKRRE